MARGSQGQANGRRAVGAAPVVTAFVWDGARVLLAQRSERVSTYPGHWAGVSGYVEGDEPPLNRALTEVEEECGVPAQRLVLRRAGEPLEAADPKANRRFRVHPFLFQIDSPRGVRKDWEAARLEWVPVDELLQDRRQPTVPRLREAFQRVWPPWPNEQARRANLEAAERRLRGDRRMGAGQLARAAAWELVKLAGLIDPSESLDWAAWLRQAAARLAAARPNMTSLENLMADAGQAAAAGGDPSAAAQAVRRLIARSEAAERETARRVAEQLPDGGRVMTISYSSTVRAALESAAPKLAAVIVCEGRPLLEGRRLAEAAGLAGAAATVITDAQAYAWMPEVDLVLLGADTVLADGAVVNKAGSALLALAARRWGKPVWVAADSLKWKRRPGGPPPPERNSPNEVWAERPGGVEAGNVYFDVTPADLVDRWIDERGERR